MRIFAAKTKSHPGNVLRAASSLSACVRNTIGLQSCFFGVARNSHVNLGQVDLAILAAPMSNEGVSPDAVKHGWRDVAGLTDW